MPDDLIIRRALHDAPGEALESGHDENIRGEMEMARGILAFLEAQFPGYPWSVRVDFRQGVACIQLAGAMPATQWFVCKLTEIATNQDFHRKVRDAGGEILEKYGQRRSRIHRADFRSLLAEKPWLDPKRLVG